MTTITCALEPERIRWQQFRLSWENYQTTLCLLDRRHDLEGLARWAKRKRLKEPGEHYKRLLSATELRLLQLQVRSPLAVAWARTLYTIRRFICRETTQYRKGAAKKYRLRKESLRNK